MFANLIDRLRFSIGYLLVHKKLLFLGVAGAGFLGIIPIMVLGGHTLVETVDSAAFCTETCHKVHYAEAVTYVSSPHSEVSCSRCHVGEGTENLVRSKVRGLSDILPAITGNYERPIPAPLQDRRPSIETCQKCHWSEKFFGDIPQITTTYATDESNTKNTTTLVLKVDGGKEEVANGIHWHSTAKVWYLPIDDKREEIGWVATENSSGNITEYIAPNLAGKLTPELIQTQKRLMDCVDCHNRVTHLFRSPDELIDKALTDNSIDISLPFIKREAVNALVPQNSSLDQADAKIAGIEEFYRTSYPEIFQEKKASIDQAIDKLREIARLTTFDDGLDWNTYPDNVRHNKPDADMNVDWNAVSLPGESQGCFRCHGTLVKAGSKDKSNLDQVLNGLDLSELLTGIDGSVAGSPQFNGTGVNASFGAASSNTTGTNTGPTAVSSNARFDALSPDGAGVSGISPRRDIFDESGPAGRLDAQCSLCHSTVKSPLASPLAPATSHPIDKLDDCLVCHSPSSVRPFKTDHPWTTNSACNSCHQSAPKLQPIPVAGPLEEAKPITHPVQKLEDCLTCHNPSGAQPIKQDHPWSTNDTCTACHQSSPTLKPLPSAAPPEANLITHSTKGLAVCLACHAPSSVVPFSSNHPWATNDTCTTCHQESPTPQKVDAPAVLPFGPDISHPISGLSNCLQCHYTGGPAAFPGTHVGRPNNFCLICHKAPTENPQPLPTPVPTPVPVIPLVSHALDSVHQDCLLCHGTSGVIPVTSTHTGRDNATCLLCHQPGVNTPTIPAAPSILSATAASATQVNLTWVDNASNESGLWVERATSSAFTSGLITANIAANASSYSDTTVVGSTTYYYRVFAVNSAGDSASNSVSVMTPAPPQGVTPPAAPSGLGATAASATQVNLTWLDNANNETGSRVERATNSTFTTGLVATNLAAGITSYSDTSVAGSTTYYFRVFAFNSAGDSNASNTVSVTTPAATINAAALYSTYCASCHGANRQGGSASALTTTALASRTLTQVISVITNGTGGMPSYSTTMTAAEISALARWLKGTIITVPAAPTGLTATAVSAGQVNLNWVDNANNEDGLRVERATNSTFTAGLITATVAANATSYSDTSVAGSTTYYYRVFAVNAAGDSTASNTASVATPAPTVTRPAAPSGLSATAASATQVNLTWVDNANNETGFRVERATNSTFTSNLAATNLAAGATSYSDTSVTGSTTYYFRVFAFNSAGDSNASNTVSVTTPAPPSLAPLIAHTTTGYTDCVACHAVISNVRYPADHSGRTNGTCTSCHQSSGSTSAPTLSVGAPRLGHSLSGRTNCLSCHARGEEEQVPSSHTQYTNITCLVCHRTGG